MGDATEVGQNAVVAEVPCELCSAKVSASETKLANGHRICAACARQLETELAQAAAPVEVFPRPVLLGALGALSGAAVWTLVVVITDWEIGYLAVLVGFLAGYGVKYGAHGAHGRSLQKAAVACAFGGLVASKYLLFAHFFATAAKAEGLALGFFSPQTIAAFPNALAHMLSPFDLLWLFIALSSAWRVPAAPRVTVG